MPPMHNDNAPPPRGHLSPEKAKIARSPVRMSNEGGYIAVDALLPRDVGE